MSARRVPFVEDQAEPLAVSGDYTLDWYTGLLTDGATAFLWPNELFPDGGYVPIGEAVIALRMWHKGVRLITVWRPHAREEYESIANAGSKILETLIQHWRTLPDAGPYIQ